MRLDSVISEGMSETTLSPCLVQDSRDQSSNGNGLVLNSPLSSSAAAAINFGASSASMDVLSIASDYYAYVEAVKQLVVESNMAVGKLQRCLQYANCLKNSVLHPVFSQSSALSKAEDLDQLFTAVQHLSSWYNHNLVTHVAKSLLGDEGKALADKYSTALTGHCTTLLLLLPQFSSGCSCPDDFEEILVDIERRIQSCSLADTIRVQETLADIFELNSSAIFLKGISQGEVSGSSLTFWIPKSMSSHAASAALGNTSAMAGEGIARIRTKYEKILSVPPKVGRSC